MDALTHLDTRDSAVLFVADQATIPVGATGTPNPGDSIWLEKNDNDEMTYRDNTTTPRFAVFSEVYYNRGWHAYIDDKEAPIVRTNFVLRGLALPAGSHTIRFEFHPASFYTGKIIQIAATVLIIVLLVLAGLDIRRRRSRVPPEVKKK